MRHFVIRVLIAIVVGLSVFPASAVAQDGQRRGELGVQLGVRGLDGEITPEDNNGVSFTWGIEGAWSLGDKWAVFVDVNRSIHDSIELCEGAEFCSALTPEVTVNVVTFGMERRLKAGPKGGQWLAGLGTGMMDLNWNGVQIHHGIVSLNVSRRMPLGPGVARFTIRTETGVSGRTDNQLEGSFENVSITNVVLLVGWGFGVGHHR